MFITADGTLVTTVTYAAAVTVLRDITVRATLGMPRWTAELDDGRWRGELTEPRPRTAELAEPRTRATVGAGRWRGNLT